MLVHVSIVDLITRTVAAAVCLVTMDYRQERSLV